MSGDSDATMQKRMFFAGIIIGILLGIFRNLAISSGFELAHILKIFEGPTGLIWLLCIFGGSIILLILPALWSWQYLKETL